MICDVILQEKRAKLFYGLIDLVEDADLIANIPSEQFTMEARGTIREEVDFIDLARRLAPHEWEYRDGHGWFKKGTGK